MANITKAERERRAKEAAENAKAKLESLEMRKGLAEIIKPDFADDLEVQITEQDGEAVEFVAPVIEPLPTEAPKPSGKSTTCPIKSDPTMGDKDPAIVAWWFENFPEIAARKYKDRIVTRL